LNPYKILFTLSLPKGNPDSEPLILMISPDFNDYKDQCNQKNQLNQRFKNPGSDNQHPDSKPRFTHSAQRQHICHLKISFTKPLAKSLLIQ